MIQIKDSDLDRYYPDPQNRDDVDDREPVDECVFCGDKIFEGEWIWTKGVLNMITVNDPVETTAIRLNRALAIRDLTQKDICDRTGLSSACVSQYSTGKAKPKADKIFLMAKALNVDETWLLGYDVPMEKSKGNFSNVNTDAIVDYIIDDDMRTMIETVSKMPDDKRLLVYQLVKSMV